MMRRSALTTVVVLLGLSACSKHPETQAPSSPMTTVKTLATVNDSPVTEPELTQAIHDNLGADNVALLDANSRHKVLESLVMSRAIAQVADKGLSPDAREELERRVASYREQLLVKDYLRQHIAPEAVSTDMVKTYYQANPERFGAKIRFEFESLAFDFGSDEKARDQALSWLNAADQESDWSTFAKAHKIAGTSMSYQRAEAVQGTLTPKLQSLLLATKVGKVSGVGMEAGRVERIRLLKREMTGAKPLAEVSTEIRKALVPIQLKKAIQAASAEVMKSAKVQYLDNEPKKTADAK